MVGNRPQFIKAAAVSAPLRARHEELLVHTGQHYDDSLSRVFFTELGLARPDRELALGGGSNTSQTARMLEALEPLLAQERPDAALADRRVALLPESRRTTRGAWAARIDGAKSSFCANQAREVGLVLGRRGNLRK